MGYRLNRLDEPVFLAVSIPLLTEFGICHRLESCALVLKCKQKCIIIILQATQEVNDGSSKDLVDALVCVQEQAVNGRLPRQDFDHGE